MEIKQAIPAQRIADLMVVAIESGYSNYWCGGVYLKSHGGARYKNCTEPGTVWYADPKLYEDGSGLVIEVLDAEADRAEDVNRKVTLASIKRGFELMADPKHEHAHHFRDFMAGNEDAVTADVWLQFCALGEVVYG